MADSAVIDLNADGTGPVPEQPPPPFQSGLISS